MANVVHVAMDGLRDQVDELQALYRLTDSLYRAQSLDDVYTAALDAITLTLGCARASILLFDDAGIMRFVAWRGLSDSYRVAVDGHTPWKLGQTGAEAIFVRDIEETSEPQHLKDTIKAEGIRGLAFIPLESHGRVIGKFMTYYEVPHTFAEHERELAVTIARQVGFSVERAYGEAARQHAEEKLRESETRFRLMSENAPVMIWMCDERGACLHLNRMLRDFWGVDEDKIATFDWRAMVDAGDAPRIVSEIGSALAERRAVRATGRYRDAGGRLRVLETSAQPRFDRSGEFLGLIGINVDVTERELLLAELNHRVKNTLAVVQGIAYQTFKGVDDAARKAFDGRLVALSVAHRLLTETSWENASLEKLVADTMQIVASHAGRIHTSGPHVLLTPRHALAIGMALHELLTNAVKYGALSNDTGHVDLTWSVTTDADCKLRLVWSEQGGPMVFKPSRRGFGSLLLEQTLAGDLSGEVSTNYRPDGLVCTIEFSLRG